MQKIDFELKKDCRADPCRDSTKHVPSYFGFDHHCGYQVYELRRSMNTLLPLGPIIWTMHLEILPVD